jgi:hypothetical protein
MTVTHSTTRTSLDPGNPIRVDRERIGAGAATAVVVRSDADLPTMELAGVELRHASGPGLTKWTCGYSSSPPVKRPVALKLLAMIESSKRRPVNLASADPVVGCPRMSMRHGERVVDRDPSSQSKGRSPPC